MKKLKAYIFLVCLLVIGSMGVLKVNAKDVEATIKLVGRNTFGRVLEIEVDCKDAGTSECYLSEAKWYYNDTNSTENGTEIVGNSDIGGTGSYYYQIQQELIGKYIYVVAKVSSYDSDYDDITLIDITDEKTNVTAVVDDYIDYNVDNSGVSITATATFEVGASLELKLNGIEQEDNTNVFVYLSDGEEPPVSQTKSGCEYLDTSEKDYTKFKSIYNSKVAVAEDWYLLKGYTKAYVVKRSSDKVNGGYYCEVLNPVTVEKPAIPSLGNRYQFYLFSGNDSADYNQTLSTYPLFPYSGENGSHQLITKIGIINDKNVLKKLSKGESDALQVLLDYAKNNEGTTFKYADEHYYRNDIGTFQVQNGAYYYVYTSYDNTDGLYRDLDDVTVVMGENGMLVNDVKWEASVYDDLNNNEYNENTSGDISDDTNDDEYVDTPTENPKTGLYYSLSILSILLVTGSIIVIKLKKHNKIIKL